jgi:hypothetical protein
MIRFNFWVNVKFFSSKVLVLDQLVIKKKLKHLCSRVRLNNFKNDSGASINVRIVPSTLDFRSRSPTVDEMI